MLRVSEQRIGLCNKMEQTTILCLEFTLVKLWENKLKNNQYLPAQ